VHAAGDPADRERIAYCGLHSLAPVMRDLLEDWLAAADVDLDRSRIVATRALFKQMGATT
jgi:hypothetical protein